MAPSLSFTGWKGQSEDLNIFKAVLQMEPNGTIRLPAQIKKKKMLVSDGPPDSSITSD